MKKIEQPAQKLGNSTYPSSTSTLSGSKEISPFEQMKATLRNNLKGLKKEEDKDGGSDSMPTSSTTVNVPVTSGGAASSLPTRRVSVCYD